MTLVLGIISISLLAGLGFLANERIRRKRQKQQRQQNDVWSIGLYEGPDPVTLSPATGIRNPILTTDDITDVPARFVADPFMIERDGAFHLFFELFNMKRNMGEIGHAVSDDLKAWRYSRVVLRERFHLSYPYVFEHDGEIYMIPECAKSKSIRLYRAASFPDDWRPVATLLRGKKREVPLLDPSVVFHDGHWYLFSYIRKANNLHLHVAESLTGPWVEHPASPVIRNNIHFARPGGRVVKSGAALYRFAQDGRPRYGSKAWGFRITELTPTSYREEAVSDTPVIQEGNEVWNGRGMHTVDPHRMPDGRWIALVDGLERRAAAAMKATR